MVSDNSLGEFLRARREVTTPEQVGLPHAGPRRTPGLRREEVAMFAGVSTDYYVRLEQGRERHPSERVLEGLVQALALDLDAEEHLHELAHPRPRRRATTSLPEQVSPDLLRMMNSWPYTPALVTNRRLDVLAANPTATALHEGLDHAGNLLRMIFLDPGAHEFFREWEQVARAHVGHVRAEAGADLDDPHLADLVGELSLRSADFRRLWAGHDVSRVPHKVILLRHRVAGDLTVTYETFNVNSAPGQQLITLHADPGSPLHTLTLLGRDLVKAGHEDARHAVARR
ncbi:helix-turn-helix transcriptional regulator [Nonomuraea mangrovi]|uniref:Helix-turn-helix transcriptional regulator n=1 Tax=Nonomuraea mangrovi TaxID=2316207 RepID=A0ABW4SLY6_9ACTN